MGTYLPYNCAFANRLTPMRIITERENIFMRVYIFVAGKMTAMGSVVIF